MKFAKTHGVAIIGVEGHIVTVEGHISAGLPNFVLVGLPDVTVRESRDRVRAAIASSGLSFPQGKSTVNLGPARLPKTGSGFDLPIAAALLIANSDRHTSSATTVYVGELGLDGQIHAIPGVLPSVLAAKQAGFDRVIVPHVCVPEAQLVSGIDVTGVSHLAHLADILSIGTTNSRTVATQMPPPAPPPPVDNDDDDGDVVDISEVIGQAEAKQALEIAAAGGHHIFFSGDPGCGKTMLARALPTILPPLDEAQAIEVTAIHSAFTRDGRHDRLITRPPFIHPHHSSTMASIIGGGQRQPRPGAISLAHRGVLFLDEAPEFSRQVLDSLRIPLEQGELTIHRSHIYATFPAAFQLVMAANPCPCAQVAQGSTHICRCTPSQKLRYRQRLSGPLMDRIDISVTMRSAHPANRISHNDETSQTVQQRVIVARRRAQQRWKQWQITCNRDVPGNVLRSDRGGFTDKQHAMLDRLVSTGTLSMRGVDKVMRLAWTVADLNDHDTPSDDDVHTAFTFRSQETSP